MNQSSIKHPWSQARLEELANKIGSGATPRGGEKAYQSDGIPLIRSQNVVFFNFKRDGLAFISEEQARLLNNVEVLANDVLLNITGASIGRVTIAPRDMDGARVNQHVCIIRPAGGIDARFLNAYLSSPDKQAEITNENYGVTRQALTKQQIADFIVPVPPLNEQKRIADKLDAVLARVDACRKRLDRVPGILKRFRQSVLAAATSGTLTEEWRAEHDTPFSWQKVRLGEIAEIQGGVTKDSKRESPLDEEVPYLRVANVQRGYLDLSEIKKIRIPADKLENLLLENGDILFNEGGDIDKLGRGWVWDGQIQRCSFQNHVFRARLIDRSMHSKYISWWANSKGLDYFMLSGKQTTNLASINKSTLSALPISLPPVEEQHEIVRRVEALFAHADALEAKYRATREQVDRLTPAVLAKAFRGELVPQDPNDEPAAELLERIRAARAAQPAAPRARRTRTPRTVTPPRPAEPMSAIPEPADMATAETPPAPEDSAPTSPAAPTISTGTRTLAELRKAAGMNQADVAKAMGLNQAYISQMETGKRTITEAQRDKLAEILGVTVEELP